MAGSGPELRAAIQEYLADACRYREQIGELGVMTSEQLGALFGHSERWGRDRIAEVRTEMHATGEW